MHRFHLLGSSPIFTQTRLQIEKVAKVDATVLIEGETGTGKEMAARAIHYMGARSDRPFVPVNCGALAEALIESELFGHERGAFTDAKSASLGLVQEAGGGTLFLDEIDALSPKAQAALLRLLQDGSYRRVGGSSARQADVRVVVASNANLQELADTKRFRKDLLYRINVLSVRMPALRERGDDAIELARVFLGRLAHKYERPPLRLAPASLAFIRSHGWPGNVRELENVLHRAVLLTEGTEIDVSLAAGSNGGQGLATVEHQGFRDAKARAVGSFERQYLSDLLDRTQGNLTKAAVLANKDRSALNRLMNKHGLRQAAAPEPRA
jgi:DNA-binding NtrC family response regulator